MIRPNFFVDVLAAGGVDFFAGVPDSLLKSLCACLTTCKDGNHHVITANEGGAIGLAAGYHLASGKIGCVYMQNSGEGNAINPLASLTDKEVYNIPMLLLIGWRGRPSEKDEPQHIKQGKITIGLLNVMGINYDVLAKDEIVAENQIKKALDYMKLTHEVYALVIERDTFDSFQLLNNDASELSMTREEAIHKVVSVMQPTDVVVSTTGMISRELFEYRAMKRESHERDFLTVGSMGHASQIALGISLVQKKRRVWCFDGDGSSIMHMGNMAIVAGKSPENYVHVVFNNGAHDSVGGQPTVGLDIDLPAVAKALGYRDVFSVCQKEQLIETLENMSEKKGPVLLEIKVKKGNRNNLGRPTTTPIQNKEALMEFLKK